MKEILEAISERIKSPIFGYFIVAFLALNWKTIFYLLFSKLDILIRFKYFDEHTTFFSLLILPLIISILSAIIYPWISYAFLYVSKKPTELRNNLQVLSEHNFLTKKQDLEDIRAKLLASKERELIERAKRDNELESISDTKSKKKVKAEIESLRNERDNLIDDEQIQIDLSELGKGILSIPFDSDSTVQDLLNIVWISYLKNHTPAYTYGDTWILRDSITKDPVLINGNEDIRPLLDVGIMGGMSFEVVLR